MHTFHLLHLLTYLHDCLGEARVGVAGFPFLRRETRQSDFGTGIRHTRAADAATRSIKYVGLLRGGACSGGYKR